MHTGVGQIFDRVLSELIKKMREMRMDKTELGCLRAIVLYNPGKLLFIIFVIFIEVICKCQNIYFYTIIHNGNLYYSSKQDLR